MSFTKESLLKGLAEYQPEQVEEFAAYCVKLSLEKDKKTEELKNSWILQMSAEKLITLYKRVALDKGLYIDGKNITLSQRGIDYNYKAYKNKMLIAYPESIIDVQLVYKDDVFSFSKKSGEVFYSHDITNPFGQKDSEIIGGYCVIKNKRGQFLTTLTRGDIEKHRKVAKTDAIWQQWFKEMALKTIIKKACATHFSDIYQNIEENDNENYNLENPLNVDIEFKGQIDAIVELSKLRAFYSAHKEEFSKNPELLKYIQIKQAELKAVNE